MLRLQKGGDQGESSLTHNIGYDVILHLIWDGVCCFIQIIFEGRFHGKLESIREKRKWNIAGIQHKIFFLCGELSFPLKL